ncbi:MAG: glycosyltransferase family 39 protein, partial [Pyrinomonadaceae bacterium]
MKKEERKPARAIASIVAGAVMLSAAVLVSNDSLERALLSDTSRTLSWGATLFRALLAFHGLLLVAAGLLSRKRRSRAEDDASSRPAADGDAAVGNAGSAPLPWVLLSALGALALALRLWRLDTDLWYDELLSLLEFVRPPLGEIVTSFSSQNQHMLYSVLAHASVGAFGESAWAVRLPSVFFGVASLWALFLLGRKVIGARESLAACALMTVSYHHIWFSQNARGYMALLFFSTLATWLWLEALERGAWRWWAAYAAAVALGMWSHMTMAFVVAAHGLLYLVWLARLWREDRKQKAEGGRRRVGRAGAYTELPAVAWARWRPVGAWVLGVSLTLQLHALSLPEFFGSALHMVSLPSEWSSTLWVVAETLRGLRVGFAGAAVVIGGGVMLGVGWLSILRRDYQAGLAMVLPAVLGGATMIAMNHYLWPRFFFFSMGFALLVAVHGATALPRLIFSRLTSFQSRERAGAAAGAALACLMIAASAVTLPRNYALPKQDYTGARDFVEQHRAPGDRVVAVALAGIAYGRYFAPHWSAAQTQAELDAVRENAAT